MLLYSADGQHSGGYIIPGALLMERALLLDKGRVRFDEDVPYSIEPGCSTAQAVRHGIALTQAGAVNLALQEQKLSWENLFICGGGGELLRTPLGDRGSWFPTWCSRVWN